MASCPMHLGPREQRKRWMIAVLALGATLVLALVGDGNPGWIRGVMALLLVVAAFGVMQARAQTCVLLAYTGHKNLDGGAERIRDFDERREAVRIANLVSVKALALALVGMLLLAWP